MEHADAVGVDVEMVDIVELLQDVMRRIVKHAGPRMAADAVEEHLITVAVMQILAGVDFIADIDAAGLGMIKDRLPAPGEFVERLFDQPGGALRPGVEIGPGQRAGKGGHRGQAKVFRHRQGLFHLIDGPIGPALGVATQGRGGEAVEHRVIGGMDRDKLALDMGGQLRHLDAILTRLPGPVLAIGLRPGGAVEVDELRRVRRHLHPDIAAPGGPFGDGGP